MRVKVTQKREVILNIPDGLTDGEIKTLICLKERLYQIFQDGRQSVEILLEDFRTLDCEDDNE